VPIAACAPERTRADAKGGPNRKVAFDHAAKLF